MRNEIVEFPEMGRLYLIRRLKGGSQVKRYEPGRIVDIDVLDGGIRVFQVKFLYDGVQGDYTAYYGLVKELSDAWLKAEHESKIAELSALMDTCQRLEEVILKGREHAA